MKHLVKWLAVGVMAVTMTACGEKPPAQPEQATDVSSEQQAAPQAAPQATPEETTHEAMPTDAGTTTQE